MNFKKYIARFVGGMYAGMTRLVHPNTERVVIAETFDGEFVIKHRLSDKPAKRAQEYKKGHFVGHSTVFYPVEWTHKEAEEYLDTLQCKES